MRKMDYPGATESSEPAAVVSVKLVEDSAKGRIKITQQGVRGGTYASSTDMTGAVDLILQLEKAVTDVAAKEGFTHPAYRKLRAARGSA